MKKTTTAQLVFAATALASQQACALGFGRVASDAVLGQPLSATVPVQVDPGERFGADCVAVEVYSGESRLLPGQVRTAVEPGNSDTEWRVRISTTVAIDEPIVEVALNAGCERRFLRRFTVFANPPAAELAVLPPAMPGATAPAGSSAVALAPRVGAGGAATDSAAGAGRAAAGARAAARARPASEGGAGSGSPLRHRPPRMALVKELNGAEARPSARHAAAMPATPAAPAALDTSRLVLEPGVPHLKLDLEDPVIPPPGAAAPAASGVEDEGDPAVRQLHALERSIQAVRRSEEADHVQAERLRAQLAQAQARGDWLPYALGLLALAVAAVAALAWKLRQQSRLHAHSAWFNESQLGPAHAPAPVPARPGAREPVVSSAQPDAPVSVGGEVVSELPAVAPEPPPPDFEPSGFGMRGDPAATQPLDRGMLASVLGPEAAAPRELSVEELLDLEQQADFFIALGQEDAAVDLLMSHLRSAGGQSPLPYTKLLEIYKRQGDRAAYERTRARFNRRFNAYAPDWDTGPNAGRTLEDYPEAVAQLQAAWHAPIDAMALLEAMLFKRDEAGELFDLPAYRDVLLLYSLARDLWTHGGGNTGTQVDVLLPLDDGPHAGAAPAPQPPAREIRGLDLPLEHAGPRSFEATGFQPTAMASAIDLEIPSLDAFEVAREGGRDAGQDVHATLDAFSLAPLDPAPPAPRGPAGRDRPAGDEDETRR